jgi:hypothetical protein
MRFQGGNGDDLAGPRGVPLLRLANVGLGERGGGEG